MRRSALALLLLAGCISYDLDERAFLCAKDDDCGSAMVCGSGGRCVAVAAPDASMSDGPEADGPSPDSGSCDNNCQAPECGPQSCDDHNPCTKDTCESDGSCTTTANPTCGAGCMCNGAQPVETACGNGIDDDGDGLTDCQDPDCPHCMAPLMCCPSGACLIDC